MKKGVLHRSWWKYLVAWAFINVHSAFHLSVKTTQHISLTSGMTKPHFSFDTILSLSLLIKLLRAKVNKFTHLVCFHSGSSTGKSGCNYHLGSATRVSVNEESWQRFTTCKGNRLLMCNLNKTRLACWRLISYFLKPVNSWDTTMTALHDKVLRFVFSAEGAHVWSCSLWPFRAWTECALRP